MKSSDGSWNWTLTLKVQFWQFLASPKSLQISWIIKSNAHSLTYLYSFQKHNLIFLRFHDISSDIRQRGRRGKYSFDYEKLQKGQRASQMLHLKKVVKGPEDTKLKVIYFWHRQYYTKWTPWLVLKILDLYFWNFLICKRLFTQNWPFIHVWYLQYRQKGSEINFLVPKFAANVGNVNS